MVPPSGFDQGPLAATRASERAPSALRPRVSVWTVDTLERRPAPLRLAQGDAPDPDAGPDVGGGVPDVGGGEPDPGQDRDDDGDDFGAGDDGDDGGDDPDGPNAVAGTFDEGFGEGSFVGTYDPATGAFQGAFTDPDGTFTISVDPETGAVTEVEDGEITTYDSLGEYQSENPLISVEIAQAIDLVEALDRLAINPETGALEGTFADDEGTFTLSVDPVTGIVTETVDGETFVHASLAAFLAGDGEDDDKGTSAAFGGDIVPF